MKLMFGTSTPPSSYIMYSHVFSEVCCNGTFNDNNRALRTYFCNSIVYPASIQYIYELLLKLKHDRNLKSWIVWHSWQIHFHHQFSKRNNPSSFLFYIIRDFSAILVVTLLDCKITGVNTVSIKRTCPILLMLVDFFFVVIIYFIL